MGWYIFQIGKITFIDNKFHYKAQHGAVQSLILQSVSVLTFRIKGIVNEKSNKGYKF